MSFSDMDSPLHGTDLLPQSVSPSLSVLEFLNTDTSTFAKRAALHRSFSMDDVSPCNLAAQKKKRRVLTGEQIHVLETTFKSTPNPDAALRTKLSGQVGLPERNVQIWFQNRRAKLKRNQDPEAKAKALKESAVAKKRKCKQGNGSVSQAKKHDTDVPIFPATFSFEEHGKSVISAAPMVLPYPSPNMMFAEAINLMQATNNGDETPEMIEAAGVDICMFPNGVYVHDHEVIDGVPAGAFYYPCYDEPCPYATDIYAHERMSPCPSEYHPSGEEDDSEEEFHQTHMSPYQTHPGLPHQLPYSEGHKHEETFYGSQRSAMNLIQGAHAIRAPSVYCAPEMEAEIASDEDDMLHAAQYLTPVSSLSPQLQHGTLGFTPILRHSYPQPAYANLQEYASYITQEDIAAAQAMIPDVSPSHSEQLFGQPMDLSVAPFIPSTASFSADYPCELVRSQSCHADEYADEDDSALEGTFQTIPYTMRRRHSIATACDPTLVPFLGFDHSALNNDDEMDVVTYV